MNIIAYIGIFAITYYLLKRGIEELIYDFGVGIATIIASVIRLYKKIRGWKRLKKNWKN